MNISVIGGDYRIIELLKFLEKDYNIFLYGFEKCDLLKNKYHCNTLEEAIDKSNIIITSIPLTKDMENVNVVFSDKNINVIGLFNLCKNKKIITGNLNGELLKTLENINTENKNVIIDILNNEELAILNSIPTAEGAIKIAIEKSNITIHNSNCLVLGFGRIGKILSKMLQGMGANVYCEARKQADLSWIKTYGYEPIPLEKLNLYLEKFDFIFNTIPYIVLDKNNLNLINKQCLIIDLASKPGGIDFEEAKKLNLNTDWALALPGKVAPKTAAQYIYEIIKSEL